MSSTPRAAILRPLLAIPAAILIATGAIAAHPGENETIITAANPQQGTVTRTMRVSTAGLNMADGGDYARFVHRVADAAEAVCADEGLWNRFSVFEYNRCRADAEATAMAQRPSGSPARD